MTGDELGEVAPVRTDVRERTRGAAEVLVDAPIVILWTHQPVLEVAAVDQRHRPAFSRADALARLTHRRVVPVDERDGGHALRIGGRVGQGVRAERVERQRLLADHVLAGGERRFGEPSMQVVRRADVHDVHIGRGHQRLRRIEGALCSQQRRSTLGSGRRRGCDTDELGAREPSRACVNGTDEPGPGDGNTYTT